MEFVLLVPLFTRVRPFILGFPVAGIQAIRSPFIQMVFLKPNALHLPKCDFILFYSFNLGPYNFFVV